MNTMIEMTSMTTAIFVVSYVATYYSYWTTECMTKLLTRISTLWHTHTFKIPQMVVWYLAI